MRPIEIIDKLESLKTDKARGNLLSKLDPEHEFWIGAHHGLRHLVKYKVEFGISDPMSYGPGVPLGVFPKILNGIESGALDEVTTVDAISAFCAHCSEDEWKRWYRPILDKRLRLPITNTMFNDHCPEEYRVVDFSLPRLVPVDELSGLPEEFVLEPYTESSRLAVFLGKKRSFVFLDDGTPVHRMLPKVFERFVGGVLDVYEVDDQYEVRDLILQEQLMDTSLPTAKVEKRMEVLKTMLSDSETVEVIQHDIFTSGDKDSIRDMISLFFEAGYKGIVLRPIGIGYHHEHSNILVYPIKKNTLTCTEIVEGQEGSKWEGRAEYLRGTGSRQGKKINTLVFHGLTFDERGTSLEDSEDLIGKKFEVVSCGLSDDGSLLFPVFQKWKE